MNESLSCLYMKLKFIWSITSRWNCSLNVPLFECCPEKKTLKRIPAFLKGSMREILDPINHLDDAEMGCSKVAFRYSETSFHLNGSNFRIKISTSQCVLFSCSPRKLSSVVFEAGFLVRSELFTLLPLLPQDIT